MTLAIALVGQCKKLWLLSMYSSTIWPIQEGTNLSQKEVTILEEVGFSFDCLHRNNAQSLFGFQSFSSSSSHVPTMSCHSLVVGLQLVVARR
jgi:hypothetical protein